jgi:hypothetical protein
LTRRARSGAAGSTSSAKGIASSAHEVIGTEDLPAGGSLEDLSRRELEVLELVDGHAAAVRRSIRRTGLEGRRSISAAGVVLVLQLTFLTCGAGHTGVSTRTRPAPPATVVPFARTPPIVLAAGDIASCDSKGDEATAKLVVGLAGTVLALGDEAYDNGSPEQFARCYARSWGRFKARTRPTPGNHDYETEGAAGYFGYFGAAAGPPGKGYYSFDLGAWHIVSLNSNCSSIGGCGVGSAEERWLRADLAAHPARCTLAYWHHPRFSSGTKHASDDEMQPIWQALYDNRADVVLSAHEHNYERFAPQTATGARDAARGIREFVVGTGGKSHYRDFGKPIANSEVRNDDTFGVLGLVLRPTGFKWTFVPAEGGRFSDSGSAPCHG